MPILDVTQVFVLSPLSFLNDVAMAPQVDLVILFSSSIISFNKAQVRENAKQAEEQYSRLITLLQTSGLQAVGKRGEKHGDLMVLVKCPKSKLNWLAKRER